LAVLANNSALYYMKKVNIPTVAKEHFLTHVFITIGTHPPHFLTLSKTHFLALVMNSYN
jgi:predicted urease superfamily metal-dependent hydrolase